MNRSREPRSTSASNSKRPAWVTYGKPKQNGTDSRKTATRGSSATRTASATRSSNPVPVSKSTLPQRPSVAANGRGLSKNPHSGPSSGGASEVHFSPTSNLSSRLAEFSSPNSFPSFPGQERYTATEQQKQSLAPPAERSDADQERGGVEDTTMMNATDLAMSPIERQRSTATAAAAQGSSRRGTSLVRRSAARNSGVTSPTPRQSRGTAKKHLDPQQLPNGEKSVQDASRDALAQFLHETTKTEENHNALESRVSPSASPHRGGHRDGHASDNTPKTVSDLTDLWTDKIAEADKIMSDRRAQHAAMEASVRARRDRALELKDLYVAEQTMYKEEVIELDNGIKEKELERHRCAEACRSLEQKAWEIKSQRRRPQDSGLATLSGLSTTSLSFNNSPTTTTHAFPPIGSQRSLAEAKQESMTERAAEAKRLFDELQGQVDKNTELLRKKQEERAVLAASMDATTKEVSRLKASAEVVAQTLQESTEALQSSAMYRQQIPQLEQDVKAAKNTVSMIKEGKESSYKWFMEQIKLDDEKIDKIKLVDNSLKNVMTMTPSLVREMQQETNGFKKTLHDVILAANEQRFGLEKNIKALSEQLMQVERQITQF